MRKVKFCDVLEYEQPSKYIVESEHYKDEYKTPVLTAGKSFVLGYTNEIKGIYHATKENPIILFDDFTTDCRYIDFDFKVKSSAVKILKLKRNDNNLKYLYYILKNIVYDTSSHKRYWISQYSKFEIKLPDIEIQNEIVKDMERIEELIENKGKQIQKIDELVKSLFVEMFGNIKEYKKLEEFSVLITKGASPRWQGIDYKTEGTLFVTSENVREGYIDISKPKYLDNKINEILPRSVLKKEDILINIVGASIGRAGKYEYDCLANINQAVALVRTKNINNVFLLQYLNSEQAIKMYNDMKKGGARENLSLKNISDLKIPNAPIELQNKFAELIKKIDKQKKTCNKIIEKLNELKKSKMQEYFGGMVNE